MNQARSLSTFSGEEGSNLDQTCKLQAEEAKGEKTTKNGIVLAASKSAMPLFAPGTTGVL